MSDPISPSGSPGQVPQAATSIPSDAATPRPQPSAEGQAPTQVPAPAAALAALEDASLASRLELSPKAAATITSFSKEAPAMNVADAAKAFQEFLKNLPSDLQFEPDAASGIVIFKVINPITQKVLRQYPPEEMVAMARNIKESLKKEASGIILDHQF